MLKSNVLVLLSLVACFINQSRAKVNEVSSLATELARVESLDKNSRSPLIIAGPPDDVAAPTFSNVIPNITVIAGREARLSCEVENLQDYKVAWVHYGERGSAVLTVGSHVLTTNDRVSVAEVEHRRTIAKDRQTWTLRISNVSADDEGDYMCQVSSVPPRKMFASLQVLVPPNIFNFTDVVTVDEGEEAAFECEATGDPRPTVAWRKESGLLPPLTWEVDNGGSQFIIRSVERMMAGAFLCVASNGVPPAVSSRALLQVRFPPVVIGANYSVVEARRGQHLRLECQFEGFPSPSVSWMEPSQVITNGNSRSERPNDRTFHLSSNNESSLPTNNDDASPTASFFPAKMSSKTVTSQLHLKLGTRDKFGLYRCQATNEKGVATAAVFVREVKVEKTTTSLSVEEADLTTTATKGGRSHRRNGDNADVGRQQNVPHISTRGDENVGDGGRGLDTTEDAGIPRASNSPKRFTHGGDVEIENDTTALFGGETSSFAPRMESASSLALALVLVPFWHLRSSP